jgi:uncharacterized Fe-S cluster-containing radical SAM superfamily enzyme
MKQSFQDLEFEEKENSVRVFFLDNYYFDIKKTELGKYKIKKTKIETEISEKKFNFLITKGFKELKNKFNNKPTIYLHKNMEIPLIGLNYFGLVDRNTSLIEVKPLTGCNFNCIYCSIDEGVSSKKITDFVIEKDFLIEQLKELIKKKEAKNIQIYINPHGEPLLYKPLEDLIKDMRKIKEITEIGIATNGLLLDKKKVDSLIKAGLTKFNISINSIDEKTAKIMAGTKYESNNILEICKYISKKSKLFIAPVWVQGYNDKEIPKLIEFSKKIEAKLMIQNFLTYRFGRNPAKQKDFKEFFKELGDLEKQHKVKLIADETDFNIKPTNKLEKPFKKGGKITANILFDGRLKGEKIAYSKNRLISIPNCSKTGKITLKIVRSKHNIFVGMSKTTNHR